MDKSSADHLDILITIQHPAHVHFYKHIIQELEDDGHTTHVFARKKDISIKLLELYNIPHTVLAGSPSSKLGLAWTQLTYEYQLLRRAHTIKPDILTAIGEPSVAHISKITGGKSIVFTDNEGVLGNYLVTPFADYVCTPEKLSSDFGSNHIRYKGYHELAYLHPCRYEPDPGPLKASGVNPHDRYFVLRFVGWNAHHDVGQHGFSDELKSELVSVLAERGDVYITSESKLPPSFEKYRLPISPHLIHDLLSFADLYAGDSQTMATEAALLGTPAIRCNSFAGENDMSNFIELEQEYELLTSISDGRVAIQKIVRLLERSDLKSEWNRRREQVFADKIDVTEFAVNMITKVGSSEYHGGVSAQRDGSSRINRLRLDR